MKTYIFGISFFLCTALPVFGTVHIIYFNGTTVFIGSDSKRDFGGHGNYRTVCKVITRNQTAALFAGRTFVPHVVHDKNGKVDFRATNELSIEATQVLDGSGSIQEKVASIKSAAEEILRLQWSLAKAEGVIPDLERFAITGTIISFTGRKPRIWNFQVLVKDWERGPEKSVDTDIAAPLQSPATYINGRLAKRGFENEPVKYLNSSLQYEEAQEPDAIGCPFTVIEMTSYSTILRQGSDLCHDGQVK